MVEADSNNPAAPARAKGRELLSLSPPASPSADEWRKRARERLLGFAREAAASPRLDWRPAAEWPSRLRGALEALLYWPETRARLFGPPALRLEIHGGEAGRCVLSATLDGPEAREALEALWIVAEKSAKGAAERREIEAARREASLAERALDAIATENRERWGIGGAA